MALILVADDDTDIRELVRLRLTAWGHEVVAVADGEAAFDALQQDHVDLAMLDVSMPGRNGLDVLATLRAQEARQQSGRLPVVVMSARCRPSDVAEAYTAGADEFLVKPFRLNMLAQVVGAMSLSAETATTSRSA